MACAGTLIADAIQITPDGSARFYLICHADFY